MTLPTPPKSYSQNTEGSRNLILEQADAQNLKRGSDVDLPMSTRVFLRSPNGARWQISVSNAGALVVTAA